MSLFTKEWWKHQSFSVTCDLRTSYFMFSSLAVSKFIKHQNCLTILCEWRVTAWQRWCILYHILKYLLRHNLVFILGQGSVTPAALTQNTLFTLSSHCLALGRACLLPWQVWEARKGLACFGGRKSSAWLPLDLSLAVAQELGSLCDRQRWIVLVSWSFPKNIVWPSVSHLGWKTLRMVKCERFTFPELLVVVRFWLQSCCGFVDGFPVPGRARWALLLPLESSYGWGPHRGMDAIRGDRMDREKLDSIPEMSTLGQGQHFPQRANISRFTVLEKSPSAKSGGSQRLSHLHWEKNLWWIFLVFTLMSTFQYRQPCCVRSWLKPLLVY